MRRERVLPGFKKSFLEEVGCQQILKRKERNGER